MTSWRSRGEKDAAPKGTEESDFARRVLAHASSPEEKLERLVAERRQGLEEQAARFEEAMRDLERREQLLRDMRSSVERLLRLGTTDLTEREVELQELGREFMEREARLSDEEAELNRRKGELGAVELKREALEQRERALLARQEELEATQAQGAAELLSAAPSTGTPAPVAVLFVPGPSYRLVEVDPRPLEAGATFELAGEEYVVARVGPVPFPADTRRCAYLERGPTMPAEQEP